MTAEKFYASMHETAKNFLAFWRQPWVLPSVARMTGAFFVVGILAAVAVNFFWTRHDMGMEAAHRLAAFKTALMLFPASMARPDWLRPVAAAGWAANWGPGLLALLLLNGILYAVLGFICWLGRHRHRLFFVLALYLIYEIWRGVRMLHEGF